MRYGHDFTTRWQAEVAASKIYDHPHGTTFWPFLMHTLGAELGHLMWMCQELPSPTRRAPLLELARWADTLGISRPARRMFYEIAMPKGGTHYYLSVTPRPLSDTSMTKDALQKFKLSKSVAQNRKIAAHILHRHEQGESIVDAAAAIAQDKLFPGRTEDALLKRWRQWRKWAEDFGSHYYLTGSPESPYVTVVIDGALPFTPDARPLPPATGGRPKNRRNVIAKN